MQILQDVVHCNSACCQNTNKQAQPQDSEQTSNTPLNKNSQVSAAEEDGSVSEALL